VAASSLPSAQECFKGTSKLLCTTCKLLFIEPAAAAQLPKCLQKRLPASKPVALPLLLAAAAWCSACTTAKYVCTTVAVDATLLLAVPAAAGNAAGWL
jgi:hypothetical protein